jgi:hypothetical protein
MSWVKLVIFLFVILICSPASAEYYKYYDENGNVHFTDDFNRIPLDQRDAVEGYEEVAPSPEPGQDQGTQVKSPETSAAEPTGDEEAYDFKGKSEDFDRREVELSREYDVLKKESEGLERLRKAVKTSTDAKKYNDSMRALNLKIKNLDQKRNQLYSDIEEYNTKAAEREQAKQKSPQSATGTQEDITEETDTQEDITEETDTQEDTSS